MDDLREGEVSFVRFYYDNLQNYLIKAFMREHLQ